MEQEELSQAIYKPLILYIDEQSKEVQTVYIHGINMELTMCKISEKS